MEAKDTQAIPIQPNQEVIDLAATLTHEQLLERFRYHNTVGVSATIDGNHAVATEHYLVAEAYGSVLARNSSHQSAEDYRNSSETGRVGKFVSKALGLLSLR